MPVPLQYQSQFIPTNYGAVENVLGMYKQDMGQREQQFDQGVAAEQMALADLAQMETTDQAKKQELIDSLRGRIEDVVNKRGGDYGAAAKDITRLIATEKSNPWYQFDKAKLGALQDYYKMKNQLGINFYSAQDPNKVTLEQYLADPTALQFQAINVGDLKELAAAKAKEYATANKQFINRGVGNMMREIGWQLGMGDEQKAQQYLQQNPAFINDILAAYNIDDPNVRAMIEQAALTGLIGQRDTRFVDDNEALLKAKYSLEQQNIPKPLTGLPGPNVPLSKIGQFKKADNVENILNSKEASNFNKNSAKLILSQVMTPEFVDTLNLTPEEKEAIISSDNAFNFIDNELQKSTQIKITDPYKPQFQGTNLPKDNPEKRENINRLNKVKQTIKNKLDVQLKLDNSDFNVPIIQVNPFNTKSIAALKAATGFQAIKDFDILSGDLATLDQKKLNKKDDYKLLQQGFEIIGGGNTENMGTFFYAKDSEGKDYLIKPKSSNLTIYLASTIDERLVQADKFSDIDFSGNILKYPDGTEEEIPINVTPVAETDIYGRRRTQYKINNLTNEEYYTPLLENEINKLKEQGFDDITIEQYLAPYVKEFINDKPFLTDKQGVIEYLNSVKQ